MEKYKECIFCLGLTKKRVNSSVICENCQPTLLGLIINKNDKKKMYSVQKKEGIKKSSH
jgi:hypothetical protein